jgi:glycosyltransferase involved in cell wall biosynthesis
MSKVLRALEPVRDRIGRVTLVGEGWGAPTKWDQWLEVRDDYYVDRDYLERLRVEAMPPVPYAQVLQAMSRAVFNPVVYRPLFEHLGLVTCRTFETPAAGTIPLFVLDPDYVREIYGAPGVELVLEGERPHEKVLDLLARPHHYAEIVIGIRERFRRLHSPEARMREMLAFIEE